MQELKIGWASRDVSTNEPVNIPGQFHMRINRGVLDPVTVTALVIDNGEDLAAFLSADLVVMRRGLVDESRAKLKALCPEFPVEKLIMNATHAHTGPAHYTEGEDVIPHPGFEIASADAYRDYLSTQIAEAVAEAYNTRKPGGVGYGYGYAVVAHSRRVVYFDDISRRPGAETNSLTSVNGHAAMYGNTNDDNFSHYEAGADHFLNLLFTTDPEGRLTGAIVNVPCPSQCSEQRYTLTADYWHDTRKAIRARFGDIFILPQCAAAGDLSPRILHYRDAQERRFRLKYGERDKDLCERSDIAQRIAEGFAEVWSWAQKDIHRCMPLRHTVETVELPKRMVSEQERQEAEAGLRSMDGEELWYEGDPDTVLRHNCAVVYGRGRYQEILERCEVQKTEKTLPMELHAVRLGDLAFATNRFELYMDYQHRIQARSPFQQTFIVQLCGQPGPEGGSYLCTERGREGRGYSASVFDNLAGTEAGQVLVEESLRLLRALKED